MKKILFILTFCISLIAHAQYLVPVLDKKSNKYGYKEKDRIEWSLPPIYSEAGYFVNRIAIVNDGKFHFAINHYGDKVSPNFKYISSFVEDKKLLLYICEDTMGRYNIYDAQFNATCKHFYQKVYFYKYNVLSFQSNELYGLMDMEGKILVPPIYKSFNFEDYYYATNAYKENLNSKMFQGTFIEAKNKEDKYGIITVNNEIIVPFKYNSAYKLKYRGAKKAFKNTIKPYLFSSKREEIYSHLEETKKRCIEKNEELSKIYPTDLPTVEKTTIKKTKNGYAFFKSNKQVSKTYNKIEHYNKYCIVSLNNKYGVTDPLGTEIIECIYNKICIWNKREDFDILLTEINNKYNLYKADGTILSTKDCDMIFLPSNQVGVALKDEQYWMISPNGNIVSQYGYENIDNYSTDKIYAECYGYKTELTIDGKEVSPIIKQIFNDAYNMPLNDNAQEKYNKYLLCLSLDKDNKAGYRALSLNNIGAMYENLGDVDMAMAYYEQAGSLGDETARKNIKRIKLDRTLNVLKQVGDALTQVAQTIDTSGSYSALQENNANSQTQYNNSYNVTASTKSNGHSYDFWKQQYDRWERNAKSCYESLTNTGYKTKKDGKDSGGSAAGSWGVVTFSGMKMNLREAQKEMKNIRAKARKEGYNIPQSNYETINVSF